MQPNDLPTEVLIQFLNSKSCNTPANWDNCREIEE
jgi:hypothetical protein